MSLLESINHNYSRHFYFCFIFQRKEALAFHVNMEKSRRVSEIIIKKVRKCSAINFAWCFKG